MGRFTTRDGESRSTRCPLQETIEMHQVSIRRVLHRERGCCLLFSAFRHQPVANQRAALDIIVSLVLEHAVLGSIFEQVGGVKYIVNAMKMDKQWSTNLERDTLLYSARRALACVKETKVLSLVCEFRAWGNPYSLGDQSRSSKEVLESMYRELESLSLRVREIDMQKERTKERVGRRERARATSKSKLRARVKIRPMEGVRAKRRQQVMKIKMKRAREKEQERAAMIRVLERMREIVRAIPQKEREVEELEKAAMRRDEVIQELVPYVG